MAGDPVAGVAVLQVQAQPQQRGVLLHQARDLHLDLVAEDLRPLWSGVLLFSSVEIDIYYMNYNINGHEDGAGDLKFC